MSEKDGIAFDVATRTLEELTAQLSLLDGISIKNLDGKPRFLNAVKQLINILAEPQHIIERVAREVFIAVGLCLTVTDLSSLHHVQH
jgi:hypothetical protein